MSKVEVPDGIEEEEAEKILKQRAKARSGSKSVKRSTRNKDDGDNSSDALLIAIGLLALLAWGWSESGISVF